MKKKYLSCNLCLFDGEGGGAAAAPAAGTGDAATAGVNPSAAGKGRRANNPLADVRYGKQEAVQVSDQEGEQQAAAAGATVTTTSDTLEARRAEFERLINGEYKDLYNEHTQNIIKNRLKENKGLEKTVSQTQEILDIIAGRYGIKDSKDYAAITKAVQEDNFFYEEAAANEGLTVEQYKYMRKMERENQELKGYRESAERQRQADQIYAGWMQEAEQVKAIYPGFDLQAELQSNPKFGKLLGAGIDVKGAFEAIHHDEIMTGAMHMTAKRIAKKTADGIASRQSRPVENGMGSQASALVRSDVSKLTKADRREIARRARRGENISF